MEESKLIELLGAAWRGLTARLAGDRDPGKAARVRDQYLYKLRSPQPPDRVRGVLAELLAEGLMGGGGPDWWYGPSGVADLWREVNTPEGSARVRDAALIAAAGGGGPKGEPGP